MLYSASDASMCLGVLLQNPSLTVSKKFPINSDDFKPILFHEILYKSISWLFKNGAEQIDEIVLDKFLQNYPEQLEVCTDNNYLEFIATIKKLVNIDNYELHYNIIRKYSLLRKAKELGIDITEFYDETKPEEAEVEKFNRFSIQEILNKIEGKMTTLRMEFNTELCRETLRAGEKWEDTLNGFESEPVIGAILQSKYLTTLYRGWQRGHLLLRSGSSGQGKTTTSIGDLCNVCANRYWDFNEEKYIDNPYKSGDGFMINTEMDLSTEIQPKFISWISGVPYHKILDGKYNKFEKERLIEAGKILYESHIELFDQPDFTATKLKEIYRQCHLWGASYCFFDYIWDNSEFGTEYKQMTSIPIREDKVLFQIATTLKSLSEEFNIGTCTGTQLNGNEQVNELLDERCIYGSKQIKTKLDNGAILSFLRPKELELVDTLISRKGFGNKKRPTHILHNFKTRFSRYGQNIKAWVNVDMGTGRISDCFCTDQYNQPINVDKTDIKLG